ncbi:hypothetical protein SEEM0047_02925, partial [Salmonella enterica subsp. enterica serovar Montevideo str. MB102109-0047]
TLIEVAYLSRGQCHYHARIFKEFYWIFQYAFGYQLKGIITEY